jgi:hypothetical protein
VAVDHALGVAGRARSCSRRRPPTVRRSRATLPGRFVGGQQVVVAHDPTVRLERRGVAVADDHEDLRAADLVEDPASTGISESSTRMTRSPRSSITKANWSGNSRMLS